jgi:hypothetical protein
MMHRRRLRWQLLLELIFILPAPGLAQADSLFDCFPMTVGNRWTYRYAYSNWSHDNADWLTRDDSGTVNQVILGKIDYPDSVLWTFRQSRTYHVHQGSNATYYTDTTMSDSATYVLVEAKSGRHELYQQVTWDDYAQMGHGEYTVTFVLPFWRDEPDSARVYRFCQVDSASVATFRFWWYDARPNARIISLKKGVGLVSLETHGTATLDNQTSTFQLLSSVVADVSRNWDADVPASYSLFQNYPNPFNPSTTIRYALPHRSFATLSVYNTLGQQVAILVNGEMEAGYREVTFNANGLASGVYFYRLTAGGFAQARKLVLVR